MKLDVGVITLLVEHEHHHDDACRHLSRIASCNREWAFCWRDRHSIMYSSSEMMAEVQEVVMYSSL